MYEPTHAFELIHMHTIQESGYNILNDEEITLHGAVICLCGDIPASSHIGGFKEGVGFALKKCQKCMARASDMSNKVHAAIHAVLICVNYDCFSFMRCTFFSVTKLLMITTLLSLSTLKYIQ